MNSVFEQKAVSIDDSTLRLSALCKGCPVGILNMPAEDFTLKLDISSLLFNIDNFISSKFNIEAIVLFGSSVRVKTITESYGLIFRQSYTKVVQAEGKQPSDIDIFVLLKKDAKLLNSRIKTSLNFDQVYEGDYSTFTKFRTIKDGMDIFCMTQEDFDKEFKNRSTVAESIIRDGVLLAGNFPYTLHSRLRIEWERKSPFFSVVN